MLSYRFKSSRGLVMTTVIAIFLALGVLFAIVSCQRETIEVNSAKGDIATLPHPLKQIQVAEGIHKGLIASDHKIYFKGDTDISVMNGFVLEQNIRIPRLHSAYGPDLQDMGIASHSNLVYALDISGNVIHVISNTTIVATLDGIVDQPEHIVADEDSDEMYVFYNAHTNGNVESRAVILAGTRKVTEMSLPLHSTVARYNPADGHIYVASNAYASDGKFDNALTVIDNHRVITTIHPLDKPDLSVLDMAINPANGDVYILLATKVVYWDRVHPPQSIDLYARGYKGLQCITVDPKRGWAYVCDWMIPQSDLLVIDKNRLVKAIPVAKWPAVIAVDAKHDYVYVGHYDPTNLSVIRGTALITTLNIIGEGTAGLVVDEARDRLYTANGDDGTVSVFGFDQAVDKPSFWQTFLPWLGK